MKQEEFGEISKELDKILETVERGNMKKEPSG